MALLDSVGCDETEMRNEFLRISQKTSRYSVIPFVLPRRDMDCAMVGFATAQWVIELLAWSYDHSLRQRHQITGLLLGYSVDAIGEHDTRQFAGEPVKD